MSSETGRKIGYTKVEDDKVIALDKVSRDIPIPRGAPAGTKSPGKYHEIPAKYNYGTLEEPIYDELLIEGPEMYSEYGIVEREYNGKKTLSMSARLQTKTNPEHEEFKKAIIRIYLKFVLALDKIKGAVGIPGFMPSLPINTGFKSPIYQKRDEQSKIIDGFDPMFEAKIIQSHFKYGEQTLFTYTDLEPIPDPRLVLEGTGVSYIPIYHIKKVYVGGGKASMQIDIKSAIVTNVVPRNTKSMQEDTAKKLKETKPNIESILKEQIAKITAMRTGKGAANVVQTNGTPNTANGNTEGGQPQENGSPNPVTTPALDLTNINFDNFM